MAEKGKEKNSNKYIVNSAGERLKIRRPLNCIGLFAQLVDTKMVVGRGLNRVDTHKLYPIPASINLLKGGREVQPR